jgi:uncharacterized protein DUF2786
VNGNVVERIKKLLRLAQSSNPHEAELALARAFELAQKHQIDVSTLDMNEESERIMHEWFHVGARVSFLRRRAIGIAMTFFNVNVCFSRPRVVFVGSEADIAIANYVYVFIVRQGTRQLRDYELSEKRRRRRMTPNKRRGFIQGFIYGISRQLGDRREAAAIDDSRTAIVLAEKKKQRSAYLDALIPETQAIIERKTKRNETALVSGFLAGRSTTINKPLTGTREAQLALT